jgi:hypothetical protein
MKVSRMKVTLLSITYFRRAKKTLNAMVELRGSGCWGVGKGLYNGWIVIQDDSWWNK